VLSLNSTCTGYVQCKADPSRSELDGQRGHSLGTGERLRALAIDTDIDGEFVARGINARFTVEPV
jgi:hypothetical protein